MESRANISETIINTINAIFGDLFTSIDTSLYNTLDSLTFIDSSVLKDKYFEKIFGTSATSGILLICNSLIIAFVIYYAIKLLGRNFSDTKIENPWSFILKIIIFSICMNSAYFLMQLVLDINSNITLAIKSIGEDAFKKTVSFSGLIENINKNLKFTEDGLNVFSVDGLIKGTLTMSMLNLLTVYALRYIMVKIFVLFSPIAILSLSLDRTSWIFRLWAKNLGTLLVIQIVVSIVLLILFSMDFTGSEIMTKFIYLGGIYALIRANSYVKEFIMGGR